MEVRQSPPTQAFKIDGFLVEPSLNQISSETGSLIIEPRIMDVLLCLAENSSRTVSRDELMDRVWNHTNVSDASLTRAMAELRHVFGDDSTQPKFFLTIRKKGYRLLVDPVYQQAHHQNPVQSVAKVIKPRRHKYYPVAIAVLILIFLGITMRSAFFNSVPLKTESVGDSTGPEHNSRLVTSLEGMELCPDLSPDGSLVVYVWESTDNHQWDLFVVSRQNAGQHQQITNDTNFEYHARWSRDGTKLAYSRDLAPSADASPTVRELCVVPSMGGIPKVVKRFEYDIQGLEWSQDGKKIYLSTNLKSTQNPNIYTVDVETGQISELALNGSNEIKLRPNLSPDGTKLAYLTSHFQDRFDLVWTDLSGGHSNNVTQGKVRLYSFDWTDDLSFVYCATSSRGVELFKTDLYGSQTDLLSLRGDRLFNPSSSAGYLVAESLQYDIDLMILGAEGLVACSDSTQVDFDADKDWTSGSICFVSGRSGQRQLWVCKPDGSEHRLTENGTGIVHSPRWAPDGNRIAYLVKHGEAGVIRTINIKTGTINNWTEADGIGSISTWSKNGDWIYFTRQTINTDIYRVNQVGTIEQVTKNGGFHCVINDRFYFNKISEKGIFGFDKNGMEEKVVELDFPVGFGWDISTDFVYAIDDRSRIHQFDKQKKTTKIEHRLDCSYFMPSSFNVSPDASQILVEFTSDIQVDLISLDLASAVN